VSGRAVLNTCGRAVSSWAMHMEEHTLSPFRELQVQRQCAGTEADLWDKIGLISIGLRAWRLLCGEGAACSPLDTQRASKSWILVVLYFLDSPTRQKSSQSLVVLHSGTARELARVSLVSCTGERKRKR
jgi:hypothetical protein